MTTTHATTSPTARKGAAHWIKLHERQKETEGDHRAALRRAERYRSLGDTQSASFAAWHAETLAARIESLKAELHAASMGTAPPPARTSGLAVPFTAPAPDPDPAWEGRSRLTPDQEARRAKHAATRESLDAADATRAEAYPFAAQMPEGFTWPPRTRRQEVPKARLGWGTDGGDIGNAYSADRLSERKATIRKPFSWEGRLYTATGGGGIDGGKDAWELVPVDQYPGPTATYSERSAECNADPDRRRNFYEGMTCQHRKASFALTRPITFYAPKDAPALDTAAQDQDQDQDQDEQTAAPAPAPLPDLPTDLNSLPRETLKALVDDLCLDESENTAPAPDPNPLSLPEDDGSALRRATRRHARLLSALTNDARNPFPHEMDKATWEFHKLTFHTGGPYDCAILQQAEEDVERLTDWTTPDPATDPAPHSRPALDPLSVYCRACASGPGRACTSLQHRSGTSRKFLKNAHAERIQAAEDERRLSAPAPADVDESEGDTLEPDFDMHAEQDAQERQTAWEELQAEGDAVAQEYHAARFAHAHPDHDAEEYEYIELD